MKANSSSRKESYSKENAISSNLTTKSINKIAVKCGYIQRSTSRISPKSLIIGFMKMVSKKRNTYADWATEIGLLEGRTFSKQALNERMQPQTEALIKEVVEKVISKKLCHPPKDKIKGVLRHFKSVKIDDSTTISLPDELADVYPGNISGGVQKSLAKIHAMYNLTDNDFPFLKVHSFSKNDQALSAEVLPYLNQGDLCLRDLGFTTLEVISNFIKKGVFYISRKGYSSNVYDIQTGTELNLIKELRRNKLIDKAVLIGKKHQIKVRLVALPVSDQQASERRRKARRDRDKRLNHSPQYYELLGYSIFITNISIAKCNANQIFELYRMRWQIEIIFKSWKGCFSLEKLIHHQCKNAIRVNCIIYLMLLYIYLFHAIWWNQLENKTQTSKKTSLSILKMANFFNKYFAEILTVGNNKCLFHQIERHCAYDKRKDYMNAKQNKFKLAA